MLLGRQRPRESKCAEHLDLCVKFHIDTMNGKFGKDNAAGEYSWEQKRESSDWLANRALGRVPQLVEQVIEDNQQIKHIYEIRWLPPDPNDHSNYIEPLGGPE
jgi:hypothetical protein